MSRLSDLIRHVSKIDPQLAKDLQRETEALADRRAFGLNFERHVPEAVELPGRPVRKNDKVRILPDRGQMPKQANSRLYKVMRVYNEDNQRWADVEAVDNVADAYAVPVEDLVVVAEFRDPIYPGLVSTGKVVRGGDKPFHTVINAENYHALQALLFTHRGSIDCIYIDPPYNTGAKDWKYNNDYVEADDHYRHSKWLAFMERRLLLAKELLNPADSVLIVTIDEKEYLRLGLLLEQVFPSARIQMISSVINPKGATRASAFARTDEYVYFVMVGKAAPMALPLSSEWKVAQDARASALRWAELLRSGSNTRRQDSPNQFYPVFVAETPEGPIFHSVGDPFYGADRDSVSRPVNCAAVWPIRSDGTEGNWQVSAASLRELIEKGYARLGRWRAERTAITYLKRGEIAKVEAGVFPITGRKQDGSIVVDASDYAPTFVPGTQWRISSHNAEQGGTHLLKALLPARQFPFPKSLYAVEDALSFFVKQKPGAVVLDFFAGSGTTAHAVMRLNRADSGTRQSISVTNNEVSADEQRRLRLEGLRPGDAAWEELGICDYITKPRIAAAMTGETPEGESLAGAYKANQEFPLAEGLAENVEFFTLSYESAMRVASDREFKRIAPFLWLRAGARGRRIDDVSNGWDVAESYGVIANLDLSATFIKAVGAQDGLTHAFIVTDEDRLFEALARQLPTHVEPVRLYSSYLRNFEIEAGRAAR